jgi:hypothetical protein
MDKASADVIMGLFKQYRDDCFNTAYSPQVIKVIPWNPDSVALSNSVKDAFRTKQQKYQDGEARNPNVKAVMTYLTNYLQQMNVPL